MFNIEAAANDNHFRAASTAVAGNAESISRSSIQ
jgi:hypothetical protein